MKVLLATLLSILAAPALCDDLQWMGSAGETDAALILGFPNSDHLPLSFWCREDVAGVVYLSYEFMPKGASEGMKFDLVFKAGDIELPATAEGRQLVIDDSFLLEGQIAFDGRFVDLITSGGTLSILAEGQSREFSLEGAKEAAQQLLETCRAS